MNFASNTAPGAVNDSVQGGCHPPDHGVLNPALDVLNDLPGVTFVPVPVEVLGHDAELHDEVAGQVFGLDLTALLPPQPKENVFITAHDDAGVRAAYKAAAPSNADI
jgi:hypothetical protein